MGELQFELTGSGEIVLERRTDIPGLVWKRALFRNSCRQSGGIGTAEPTRVFLCTGTYTLRIAENLNYSPSLVVPQIEEGNTAKAGDTVTISIPALDTDYLVSRYKDDDMMLNAFTVFETDIAGCEIKSSEATSPDYVDKIKTIQFTVPEDTEPGRIPYLRWTCAT